MTTPSHEPGLIQEVIHGVGKIVEPIMRPLNVVSKAISDRLEHWLTRKPMLHVRLHPQTAHWCLAFHGTEDVGMQLSFVADLTHDDPDTTLLLIEAYVKGTKPWIAVNDPIEIPPEELITPQGTITLWVKPVVGKVGENWTGRIIFIDQFHRRYKTNKFEFKFSGPQEHPVKAKAATTPTP